jgi:hypothetical protein
VAVVGCLSTLAVVSAIVLINNHHEPIAYTGGQEDPPRIPGPDIRMDGDYPAQVPEFWTWLRSRTPEPPEQRRWLAVVTDATRQAGDLVIRTGLPVTGYSYDTAVTICAAGVDFITLTPELGLRSVNVTARSHDVLAAGDPADACHASVIR